jgi:hypothetical protein
VGVAILENKIAEIANILVKVQIEASLLLFFLHQNHIVAII